jgi:RNA polymerase sigma-70 factor (ECF subfamily)
MVNTSLDALRKAKRFQTDANLEEVDYKVSTFELASDQLQAADLLKIINEMPDGYKVVFNLFAIEGYGHKEIGELLGISENTSKSQYSRARAFLKTQFEKFEIER